MTESSGIGHAGPSEPAVRQETGRGSVPHAFGQGGDLSPGVVPMPRGIETC